MKIIHKLNRKREDTYYAQCPVCGRFIRIRRDSTGWYGRHCRVKLEEIEPITEREIERAKINSSPFFAGDR